MGIKHPTYYPGPRPRVLAIVLAGGEGTRLHPLTADRAKPAVPFGGSFRIIDFVLSNLVNSGIHRIKVLTQYKSDSLLSHIARGWRLSSMIDHYVEPVPAQQRLGKHWFRGSADALHQSYNVVADENPDYIAVFGGDHIYRMDVRQMLAQHINTNASLTVAALPVPADQAGAFGVIEIDENWQMVGFEEKPKTPKEIPGQPGMILASMGNYIFTPEALRVALDEDQTNPNSVHDFGRNIVPMLFPRERVSVYNFLDNEVPGMEENARGYWRDVGTLQAFVDAHMDLIAVEPVLNLYNERWPIHSTMRPLAPAKFVFADKDGDRMGFATDSMVSPGCVISGGRIDHSVLFPKVRINSYATVERSILMDGVVVGRYSQLRNVIVDKHVDIPPRTQIGHDHDLDRKRGLHVSEEGIVVVPKGFCFPTTPKRPLKENSSP